MSSHIDHTSVAALFAKAMADGGSRRSLITIDWDISQDCENPVGRTVFARPAHPKDAREIVIDPKYTQVPLQVELDVRCRKCRKCMEYRRRVWAARAVMEYRMSYRTWLATFTFSTPKHDEIRDRIRLARGIQGSDFDCFSASEQLRLRANACSKFLTLWFKRVRKNSGAKLRYMMVMEAHKSGLPHYHALIHEPEKGERVTKMILEAAWPYGFTNFKLLPEDESRHATYACKYLSKSSLARVRASRGYGGTPQNLSTPQKNVDPPSNFLLKKMHGD